MYDNEKADYVFRVGGFFFFLVYWLSKDVIFNSEVRALSKTYILESLLWKGCFGQVLKCMCQETHCSYAVKVTKNLDQYLKQVRKIYNMIFFFFVY
jgi:hypothetical protein